MSHRQGPQPRMIQLAQAQPMAPSVEVGTPQIEPRLGVQVGQPQIHGVNVQVGQPQIEPQEPPRFAVQVGQPQLEHRPAPLPANPGHHDPFKAQAANIIMHGRKAGWHPTEIAAAIEHVKQSYDNYGAAP